MTAPGTVMLSGLSIGKETTPGTRVATTRAMYPGSMAFIKRDTQKTRHATAQRGKATNITYSSTMGEKVDVAFTSAQDRGCSYNDLIFPLVGLKGGVSPTAATLAITYVYTTAQGADPAAETLTLEGYSDIQEVEIGYLVPRGFGISAARDAMTQLSIDWFGQTVAKSTKTTPVHNNDINIPGNLWTIKYATAQSGLAGASISANHLRAFDLKVDTGYRPHFYLDGTAGMGQAVRSSNVAGTISLTMDDTSLFWSEIYDKADANTPDFVRLKATGPALSAANYDAQFDLCVQWDDPSLWAADVDGVNTHTATGTLTYDATWTNSIVATIVCSATALTA